MANGPELSGKFCQCGNSFRFVFGQHNVAGQTKHFEQFNCLLIYIRKNNLSSALLGNINNSQENGNADAIDQFGVAEINNKRPTTCIQLPATFALYSFTC